MSKRKEKLQEKIGQLQSQLKDIERRERAAARKQDTKKKILIGAMIQTWVEQGRFSEEALRQGLDQFLSRESERSLFGLRPKGQPAVPSTTSGQTPPSPDAPAKKATTAPVAKIAPISQTVMQVANEPVSAKKPRLHEVDERKLAEEFL